MTKILRGRGLSFTRQPEEADDYASYSYFEDGAILVSGGLIKAVGNFADMPSGVEVVDQALVEEEASARPATPWFSTVACVTEVEARAPLAHRHTCTLVQDGDVVHEQPVGMAAHRGQEPKCTTGVH